MPFHLYGEIPDYRYRLIDYVGDGVLIGLSLGSPFYFIGGFRNSPSGRRLAGGAHAVCRNVPRCAGRGGGQLAVFWALESGMSLARRRREDEWNTIFAGTAAFGLANLHRGAPAAARSALLGATLFVGVAFASLSLNSWHSGLVGSGRELRWQGWLPAVLTVKRTPCRAAVGDAASAGSMENRCFVKYCPGASEDVACFINRYIIRSENDAALDLFAIEQMSEMSKDV